MQFTPSLQFAMKVIYILFSVALLFSCNSNPVQQTRIVLPSNFSYRFDKKSGVTLINIAARIDTIALDALFDTGCPGLVLDKSIAAKLPYLDSIRLAGGMTVEDVEFSYSRRKARWKLFHNDIDVVMVEDTLRYEKFFVADLRNDYGADAIISIPESDEHIWCFDFENCRIDLEDGNDFTAPVENSDLATDLYFNENYLCVRNFPIVFNGADDTLSTSFDLLVDTGTYGPSITMICEPESYKKEKAFLEENSILDYEEITSTRTYHIVGSGIVNDTLVVSSIASDYGFEEVVAGLGLLSRFNIIFDLGRQEAYFKRNGVEEDFYEYVQNHGACYSGINMIPFKNNSAAVAIDVGRDMPSYRAGLRNYDVVTHLGKRRFSDRYAGRYFYEHKDSIMELGISRFGERMNIKFFWDLPDNSDSN